MNKKLVLAALGTMLLCANAFAQDAKTVIANAQKALGNPKAVTYSGSARDVAFQQCGGNAAELICHGTHDPMRPITSYTRLIDLTAPLVAAHGQHAELRRGREYDAGSRHVLPTGHHAAGRRVAAVGPVARALHHAVGLLERRGREQRGPGARQGRQQELHAPDLESQGQSAVGQELRDQRLRGRREHRRASRDLARREHHGRHDDRRELHRLARLRRLHVPDRDQAVARRLAVLRGRRDERDGQPGRPSAARARAAESPRRSGRPAGGPAGRRPTAGAQRHVREARRRALSAHDGRRQLRFRARRVQDLRNDARGGPEHRASDARTSRRRRSCSRASRFAT